jgi:CSLREA domain-containing protein
MSGARSVVRFGWIGAGVVGAALLLAACHAPKTFTVDSTADAVDAAPGDGTCATAAGACTLRAAIQEADAESARATIVLPAGAHYTLTIAGVGEDAAATGDLDVTTPITVDGNGATVDANHLDRVFDLPSTVASDTTLTLDHVTVTGGTAPSGGGIHSAGPGTITLVDSTVDSNQATGSESCTTATDVVPGVFCDNNEPGGGGIASATPVTLTNSTVSHNHAGGPDTCVTQIIDPMHPQLTETICDLPGGGGVTGPVVATDSTISANQSGSNGAGGVSSFVVTSNAGTPQESAASTLTHVTMAGNVNTGSGQASAAIGTLSMSGTAVSGTGPLCAGQSYVVTAVRSSGYSAATDGSCGLTNPTDHANATMPLLPLAANGGPTQTNLPQLGGVLLDAVPSGISGLCDTGSTDQRGVARLQNGRCDIGAVEGDSGTVGAPAQFTVTDAGDAPAVHAGDGHCTTAAGTCTLRAAVEQVAKYTGQANSITLAPGLNPTLTLNGAEDASLSGDLDVKANVAIEGNGDTVTSQDFDRIFDIGVGGTTPTVSIHHVTLTGGSSTEGSSTGGGALLIHGGAVTVSESTITGNTATNGGAIEVEGGTLTIDRTTIDHNTATSSGSSASLGGGLYLHGGTVTATNDTFEANTASGTTPAKGGNIAGDAGHADLRYTTVTGGAAPIGPGAWGSVSNTFTFTASLLENAGGNCSGFVGSAGYTVISDGTCGFMANATDLPNTPVMLGALADNGGPTHTRVPTSTSAAVLQPVPGGTAGLCDASFPQVDQRNHPRWSGGGCDRGSVEVDLGPLSLTVNSATDGNDATPGDGVCATSTGVCTLRAAITETNAWAGPDTITIAPGINPTLSIAGTAEDADANGDLDITDGLTIHGGGATLTAGPTERVLDLVSGTVAIDHLTVTGGHDAQGGDIRVSSGTATFDHVTVENGRSALGNGGGLYLGPSTVSISDSTIENNTSTFGGAGIRVAGSTLTITGSTLNGNRTTASSGASGGAISNDNSQPQLSIQRSTISDNAAGQSGGALSGDANLSQVTVADNTAADGSTLNGGYFAVATVVSGGGPLCSSGSGVEVGPEDFDLIGDASCLGLGTSATPQEALLGPLTDNGGPTLTRELYTNSPGVDAIPTDVFQPGRCDSTTPTDQRGVARPSGTGCDIGAVEGTITGTQPPVNLTVNTAADNLDDHPGDGVCHDIGGAAGQCSLRAAIDEANASGTAIVTISPGVNPTLTRAGTNEHADVTGDLDSFGVLTIHGNGATINAAGLDRVLTSSESLTIDHATLTGGDTSNDNGQDGGAVAIDTGAATLDHDTVSGNHAAASGGAVEAGGQGLTVVDSTVANNVATSSGGGIDTISGGPLTVSRSTISGNQAGFAGAISSRSASTTISQSTISSNTAASAGALSVENTTQLIEDTIVGNNASRLGNDLSLFGAVTFGGDVLANSPGECDIDSSFPATITSLGYNIAADSSCGLTQATDHQGAVVTLGALANNGGPTQTLLPAAGSIAIDAIPVGTANLCDSSAPTDQRGVTRPQGTACDIGAVERRPSDP